jgi:hypothetical protein
VPEMMKKVRFPLLQCFIKHNSIDVVMTIHMLDNSKKTFKVKSSARSAAVAALMAQKLRLAPRHAKTFMLFVSTPTTERSLQVCRSLASLSLST